MSVLGAYEKIRTNLANAGLDPERQFYTIGDNVDGCRVLWEEAGSWFVGTCERGKNHSDAKFNSYSNAAEYLVFLILQPALQNGRWTGFPEFDWT